MTEGMPISPSDRAPGPFRSLRLNNFVARHPDRLPLLQALTFTHMPAFVDREWVLRRSDLLIEDWSLGYDDRFMAGHVWMLTDWPEECTMEPVHYAEVVAQALRLAGGARKLGQIHYDLGSGSEEPSAPRRGPFGSWLDGIRRTLPGATTPGEVVRRLIAAGQSEDARDFALIEGLFLRSNDHRLDGLVEAVAAGGPELASVATALGEWRRFAIATASLLDLHVPRAVEKAGGDVHSAATAVLDDHAGQDNPIANLLDDVEGEHGEPRYLEEHRKDIETGMQGFSETGPEVAVPSFVDAVWLSKRMGLSGSVRGAINARRDVVERFSSVGRVQVPPRIDPPSILAMALEGLRQPFLLTALNLDVLSQDKKNRGRWDTSLFRPFYKEVASLLKGETEKTGGTPDGFQDMDLLKVLVDKGHIEAAKGFCVLRGAELYDEGFAWLLKDRPEYDEVAAFLLSRRRLKAWSDLVGTPGLSERYRRLMGYGRAPSAAEPPPPLVIEAHPSGDLGPSADHRVFVIELPLVDRDDPSLATEADTPAAKPSFRYNAAAGAAASWSATLAAAARCLTETQDGEPDLAATLKLKRLIEEAELHAREWAAAKTHAERVETAALALRQAIVALAGACGSPDVLPDLPEDAARWTNDPERFVRISLAALAAVEEATEIARRVSAATDRMVVTKAARMAQLAAEVAAEGARLDDALGRISKMVRILAGDDDGDPDVAVVPPAGGHVATPAAASSERSRLVH